MHQAVSWAFALLAAGHGSLSLDVQRSGLKYTGPCRAVVHAAGEGEEDRVVVALEDASERRALPPGRYEAVVTCPSTEGDFTKAFPFQMRGDDEKVAVDMRPGFLLVNVSRDGVVAKAEVKVSDERGRRVAVGRDRAVLPVPPGRLRVEVKVPAESAGTSRAVLGTAEAVVVEGKRADVAVDTTDGTLLVTLRDNGREAEGVAALRLPGRRDRFVEFEAGSPAPVPPGTYDLVTQLRASHDFAEEVKRGVVIEAKKKTVVVAAHRTGALMPRPILDGRAFAATDGELDVELFKGEAPEAFNTIAPGEAARLSPGSYRVLARRRGVTLDDGSPWQAEGRAVVRAGGSVDVRLDLTPARLQVQVTVGGAPKALPVRVHLPGGASPVATATADAEGRAELALPPGRYVVKAELAATPKPIVVERTVTLARGGRGRAALAIDVGTVVVQAFERGVAVPAEVSFFRGAAAAPTSTVGAGEEALLPPGAYVLVVRRKGEERRFGEIRVANGRLVERQVELIVDPAP